MVVIGLCISHRAEIICMEVKLDLIPRANETRVRDLSGSKATYVWGVYGVP